MRNRQKGFTLMELIVVIIILAVLVGVGIPKYLSIVRKSRESALKGALATVRAAIAMDHADRLMDNTGSASTVTWPTTIVGSMFDNGLVPMDPVQGTRAVTLGSTAPTDETGGWLYNVNTGQVIVNSTAVDLNTTAYSSY